MEFYILTLLAYGALTFGAMYVANTKKNED